MYFPLGIGVPGGNIHQLQQLHLLQRNSSSDNPYSGLAAALLIILVFSAIAAFSCWLDRKQKQEDAAMLELGIQDKSPRYCLCREKYLGPQLLSAKFCPRCGRPFTHPQAHA
jgi:hypothetical protein